MYAACCWHVAVHAVHAVHAHAGPRRPRCPWASQTRSWLDAKIQRPNHRWNGKQQARIPCPEASPALWVGTGHGDLGLSQLHR